MVRDIGGFPDRYNCSLRYNVAGTLLGAGTSTVASQTYLINAPASLSHTPKGWDVLKEPYDQYLVTAFKARVTLTNLSSTIPVKLFVVPANSDYAAALASSVNDLAETDGIYTAQIGIASGGHDVGIIDYPRTTITALLGQGKPVDTNNFNLVNYTGSSNSTQGYAAPTDSFSLLIAAFSLTGANIAANALSLSLELTMDVTFFDRLPIY